MKYKSISLFILVILAVFIVGDNNSVSFALENGVRACVISSKCDLYSQPDFNSDKVTIEVDGQAQVASLKHGQEVTVLSEVGDFAFVMKDSISGYAYKYYLTQNEGQEIYPVFNGSIRKDTAIYDIEEKDSGFIAKKDARVFIYEGFDSRDDFVAVQIVLEDGSLYNGLIKKEDVSPDGISGLLIAAITIIIAAVTIILSLLFIRHKRKKSA